MRTRRLSAAVVVVAFFSILVSGCSQQPKAVDDPKCIAFREVASTYTNKVTKARYEKRMAEAAAVGKAALSPEVGTVKRTTDLWLKAKSDLDRFYAADKSGCVSG